MSMQLGTLRMLVLDTPSPSTGNIYPTEVMQEAIRVVQDKHNGELLGELWADMVFNSHLTMERQLQIDLEKTSHRITNLHIDGGVLWGDVEILDTPYGQMFMEMVPADFDTNPKTDVELGWTFGLRSLIDYRIGKTVGMCQIVTFDAVYAPNTTLQ